MHEQLHHTGIVLSVIICTHNRAHDLRECLDSLSGQTVSVPFEVVVVENQCTDDTTKVIDRFSAQSAIPILHVVENSLGLSFARNAGIRAARGEILIFLDDDALVTPGWIQAHWHGHHELGYDCVGGRIWPKFLAERPNWLKDDEHFLCPLGYTEHGDEPFDWTRHGVTLPGGNMSFSRTVFTEVGFFRTDLGRKGRHLYGGEDEDFCRRVYGAGFRFLYMPSAMIWHKVPAARLTRRYFLRNYWFGGCSAARQSQRKALDLVKGMTKHLYQWLSGGGFYYLLETIYYAGWLWTMLRNRR